MMLVDSPGVACSGCPLSASASPPRHLPPHGPSAEASLWASPPAAIVNTEVTEFRNKGYLGDVDRLPRTDADTVRTYL